MAQPKSWGKQLIGKVHLWLGLSSGLVVFILGITGCIYVFIDEIKPLVYSDQLFVETTGLSKKPLSYLLKSANAAVGDTCIVGGLSIPLAADASYQFYTSKSKEDGFWYWDGAVYNYTIYVNPYTGQTIKVKDNTFEFFNVIFWMHWSLLLSNGIGQPIVGVSVLIFVVSLITGLILWWPKNKAAAKQRYWFRWKENTQWRRKNYDLHNILGFYVMIFTLLIALTGLVWAFDWFGNSVQWLANGGETYESKMPAVSDTTQVANGDIRDQIYQHARKTYPDAVSMYVSLPGDKTATYNVYVKTGKHTYYNNVGLQYDQFTAKLLSATTFADKNNGDKVRSLNYDIHVGGICGIPGKIIAFLASLVAASLPVTGVYIWLGRKNKNEKKLLKSKLPANQTGRIKVVIPQKV